MPAVCRFYSNGYCKFGNNCKFEHPGAGNNLGSNRFASLSSGGYNEQSLASKYQLDKDTIQKDLTTETPQWILSAYAPGKNAPEQLFGGYPREQQFEEIRLHFEEGAKNGRQEQALKEIQELYQNAQAQNQNALANLDNAVNFILEGEKKKPNRNDICNQSNPPNGTSGEFAVGRRSLPQAAAANPFSSAPANNAPQNGSVFGQSSGLGQRANPFGAPAFGQPSQPSQSGSGFGQFANSGPSPFGAAGGSKPAFGTPAFGQPSQPVSAFGQASTLGQRPSPFGAPAFGQSSQPSAASNPFSQPTQPNPSANPFGQSSQATNSGASPFGAPSNTGGSAFGQPSQLGSGPTAFGQTSSLGQKPNPFGTAPAQGSSPFGQQAPTQPPAQNVFGQTAQGSNNTSKPNPFSSTQSSSPFASQAPATGGVFGGGLGPSKSNPFSAPADPGSFGLGNAPAQNPFASASGHAQPTLAFGQPAFGNGMGTTQTSNASGQPPDGTGQHPNLETYAGRDGSGRLVSWRNTPVSYKDAQPGYSKNGLWTRIWFPDGAPNYNPETELPALEYDEKTKNQWIEFSKTGQFAGGLLPELPPLREHCRWDF